MALSIDTSRALRTLSERQRLVEAIRDAPPHEQETNWLEWKCGVDLSEKRWQREIARQVLCFANRHPDRAAANCGGCGYVVFGVEPGELHGVAPVDAAKLNDWVSAYVGKDGPRWDPDYVDVAVDAKNVLVVTVEPPQWGDRMFPLEKAYDNFLSGYVFIRRGGKTEQADAQEIRVLSERAAASGDRLAVDLDWWKKPGLAVPIDVSDQAVEAWVKAERDKLLTREKGLGAVSFAIVNATEHNFAEVNVVMEFKGDVWSAFEPSDINLLAFPPRPEPWIQRKPKPFSVESLLRQATMQQEASHRLRVGGAEERKGFSYNDGSTTLRFSSVDVRPHHHHGIGPVHLITSAELAGGQIEGSWYATSSSASGMARGVFAVPVAELSS